jgi:hypothetical protein
MKKTLLIILLALLGVTQAVAQWALEYVPTVREGVKWVNEKVIVNHGDTTSYYYTYEILGKKQICPEIEENPDGGCFEMCHYAMVTWNRKEHGTIQLCGHSHGSLDGYNEASPDLRVDVGLDGKLADYKFLTPDDILVYFYNKVGTKDFNRYVEALRTSRKSKNNIFKRFISCIQEAIGLCSLLVKTTLKLPRNTALTPRLNLIFVIVSMMLKNYI